MMEEINQLNKTYYFLLLYYINYKILKNFFRVIMHDFIHL